jgi:metal-dependent HD superfamily phosphatase/phosphodiesterase
MNYDLARLDSRIEALLGGNSGTVALYRRLAANQAFVSGCDMANTVAVSRLGYNDHGRTHVRIAAENALTILNILHKRRIVPNFVKEKNGSFEDSQAVAMLGAMLHDQGNAIQRHMHEYHGIYLAGCILDEVLPEFYSGAKLHKVRLSALGCVFETSDKVACTSVESGCVKIADGTDCEKGRARMPYKLFNKPDIHSISALAIRRVEIAEGKSAPVRITVDMTNPAGLFQVSEVLGRKVESSGLREHVEVEPLIKGARFKDTDVTLY